MADGNNDSSGGPPPPASPPPATPPPADPPKTFSQDDVNRLMGERAAQAKTAAVKEIAEKLGVPVDDAKSIIEKHIKAEKDAMSEAEKAAAAAKTDREAAAMELTAARHERTSARVTNALSTAGILDEKTRIEIAVLVAAKLDPSQEATQEQVTAAVDAVKEAVPVLFGKATLPPSGEPGKTATPPPPGGAAQQTAAERGRERALSFQGLPPAK